MENRETTNKLTKKDLRKMFWRIQLYQWSFDMERYQALGFLYTMIPALKKIYADGTKEERANSMKRHLEFFNSQTNTTALIIGITAALEENTAEDEKDSVIAVKTSLMGPLAGLGDSILKFMWLPICASIGASLALEGSVLGPIIMLVMFNAVNITTKYWFLFAGYYKGEELLSKGGNRIIERITNVANLIGAMVVGGMVASTVYLSLGLTIDVGDEPLVIQSLLDKMMPSLLPVLLTLACYAFLKKTNRKHLIPLLIGMLAVGTVLAMLGIIV